MKDIPIIFSAPMVRALLDGRKTMTRRLARTERKIPGPGSLGGESDRIEGPSPWQKVKAGDRLWVRENFAPTTNKAGNNIVALYAADGDLSFSACDWAEAQGRGYPESCRHITNAGGDCCSQTRARVRLTPCIHMPRWASRLTLIVTGVKVERLQDISEEDARAEGVEATEFWRDHHPPSICFSVLWNALHGAGSWHENPFVVGISFRVIKANIDAPEARIAA